MSQNAVTTAQRLFTHLENAGVPDGNMADLSVVPMEYRTAVELESVMTSSRVQHELEFTQEEVQLLRQAHSLIMGALESREHNIRRIREYLQS